MSSGNRRFRQAPKVQPSFGNPFRGTLDSVRLQDDGRTQGRDSLEHAPLSIALDGIDVLLSEAQVDRALEAARMARELSRRQRVAGPELASKLEEQPERRARLLIENDARFQTWGLVQELLERVKIAIFETDSSRALRLARLAAAVAGRVDLKIFGGALKHDLEARAWAELGNAYRYASQLDTAAEALGRARDLLTRGTGDPLEEGHVLSLEASLALSAGKYAEALDLLRAAERIYSELGEGRLLGKTLVQRALTLGWEDPQAGAVLCLRAERLLDRQEDARYFLMARHNRIIWLIDTGQTGKAGRLFQRSLHLYRAFEDHWTLLHRAWAEARLSFELANVEEAKACFEVLLDELLAREQHLNAALCALDLAACHLAQGQTRKASELAAAMAQHLREWGAHARARDAWAVLQQALAMEKATDALLRQLGRYLQRAWRNPHLAFQPRSSPRSRA